MLRVEDLRVSYGRVAALRGVSIEVREGELVGIVGPNGAGKTTLLGAISGVLRPNGGDVLYEGDSLVGVPPERIVRRGIALVPEGRRIFAAMTVEENLLLALNGRRSGGDGFAEDRDAVMDRLPKLRGLLRTTAGKLSGGEQQILAIARALLCRPRLLMLDEPSLGLAPVAVDAVFDVLAGLPADGVTVLLVEQNVRRTLKLADRAYVIRQGEVAMSGDRGSLANIEHLADAYLGVTP